MMKNAFNTVSLLLVCTCSLLFLLSCGGDDTKKDTAATGCTGSFAETCTILLEQQTCNVCHVPGQTIYDSQGAKIDFTSATTLYTSLTTLSSGYNGNNDCIGIPYINTTTATKSFLLGMIDSSLAGDDFAGKSGCTISDAHASDNFTGTAANLSTIKAWITAGAAR